MRRTQSCLAALLIWIASSSMTMAATLPALLQPAEPRAGDDSPALQRQRAAIARMAGVQVQYSKQGHVSSIGGRAGTGIALSTPRDQRHSVELEREVRAKLADLLLASGAESLHLEGILSVPAQAPDLPARHRLRFSETIDSVPISHAVVFVDVEEPVGVIAVMMATWLSDNSLPRKPKLTADEAAARYVKAMEATGRARAGTIHTYESQAVLTYFGAASESGKGLLAWEIISGYLYPNGGANSEMFWVDALDGIVIQRQTTTYDGPVPEYTANRTCSSSSDGAETGAFAVCNGVPAAPTSGATACKNPRRIRWKPVAGATTYYGEYASSKYGWVFGDPFVDGPYISCTLEIRESSMIRVKACNGCGCSDWSQTLVVEPAARCD